LGSAQRFGSKDVCVATIDCGINFAHPDIDTSRVTYVSLCPDCARSPDDPHGLAVLGIISATSNNGKAVSGIAPGVRHIAVQLPRDWNNPAWYAQMIVWLSGVEPHITGFPVLDRAADIISASHGSQTMATPSVVADAFAKVTQLGRPTARSARGRGTILVYSAGNDDSDMAGTQALATDPNVISVGNTVAPEAGPEVRQSESNYGDNLDLCAQGQAAPSLYLNPEDSLRDGSTCTPNDPTKGAYFFGGTSAACPMVAATAALMLTINQQLTSQEVREKLRATAQCVDPLNGNWQNGRSYKYGSGRLDVHRAVKAADTAPGVG
jgi:subtilisin family serine protease